MNTLRVIRVLICYINYRSNCFIESSTVAAEQVRHIEMTAVKMARSFIAASQIQLIVISGSLTD